ncbi:hypothetical protein CRUP_019486 [Coryphaenoides rupestris]|nr:hypothetical protein CRUP_019486 [Coryphaenoides rupestris]
MWPITYKADVFSYGIVLCEVIARIQADPDFLPRTETQGRHDTQDQPKSPRPRRNIWLSRSQSDIFAARKAGRKVTVNVHDPYYDPPPSPSPSSPSDLQPHPHKVNPFSAREDLQGGRIKFFDMPSRPSSAHMFDIKLAAGQLAPRPPPRGRPGCRRAPSSSAGRPLRLAAAARRACRSLPRLAAAVPVGASAAARHRGRCWHRDAAGNSSYQLPPSSPEKAQGVKRSLALHDTKIQPKSPRPRRNIWLSRSQSDIFAARKAGRKVHGQPCTDPYYDPPPSPSSPSDLQPHPHKVNPSARARTCRAGRIKFFDMPSRSVFSHMFDINSPPGSSLLAHHQGGRPRCRPPPSSQQAGRPLRLAAAARPSVPVAARLAAAVPGGRLRRRHRHRGRSSNANTESQPGLLGTEVRQRAALDAWAKKYAVAEIPPFRARVAAGTEDEEGAGGRGWRKTSPERDDNDDVFGGDGWSPLAAPSSDEAMDCSSSPGEEEEEVKEEEEEEVKEMRKKRPLDKLLPPALWSISVL